jgi:HSP20 family molecular chaperone IbpA
MVGCSTAPTVFFKESPVAVKHMVPPVDVIEDKDTYHFYFDMPGLKSDSPSMHALRRVG